MILPSDAGKTGTVSRIPGNPIGVVARVYNDPFGNENVLFDFKTATGTYEALYVGAYDFEESNKYLKPGWYEDTDLPIREAYAPWYVDSDGNAHSFFLNGQGVPNSVTIRVTPELRKNLRPLAN